MPHYRATAMATAYDRMDQMTLLLYVWTQPQLKRNQKKNFFSSRLISIRLNYAKELERASVLCSP